MKNQINSIVAYMQKYTSALVALGGNEYPETMPLVAAQRNALNFLNEAGVDVIRVSRFFHTPCFPAGAGNDFVNAAAVLKTLRSAEELLSVFHEIESKFGRKRHVRWGERPLDIDLIAYGDQVAPDSMTQTEWRNLPLERQLQDTPDQLILPHPRVQDRAFVLVPLCDVAPDWVHPLLGQSIRAMCAALPRSERDCVVPIAGTRVVNQAQPV